MQFYTIILDVGHIAQILESVLISRNALSADLALNGTVVWIPVYFCTIRDLPVRNNFTFANEKQKLFRRDVKNICVAPIKTRRALSL